MKSKEAGVQEKIKPDPDPSPSLQQGHYVRDPTATNRRVSGSHRVSWGHRAEPSWGSAPLPIRAASTKSRTGCGYQQGLGHGMGASSVLGQSRK